MTSTEQKPAPPTLAARLRVNVAEALEGTTNKDGVETVDVPREKWIEAARALRDHEKFVRFIDLTAIDMYGVDANELRYEVHLVVYSMDEKRWARLRTRTDGKLASVFSIYAGVHNYEREAFDMFGVTFEGHPQLTRILCPDGWKGHPLRRDEPLMIEPVDFTVTRDVYKT